MTTKANSRRMGSPPLKSIFLFGKPEKRELKIRRPAREIKHKLGIDVIAAMYKNMAQLDGLIYVANETF
jgi:hypothetical protein